MNLNDCTPSPRSAKSIRNLALATLLAILIPLALSTQAMAYTMEVTGNASYYSKANANEKYKVATAHYGTNLNIIKKGKTWSKFKVNGKYRYIKTTHLRHRYFDTKGYGSKLYKSPSTSAGSKGYLPTGAKLKFLGSTVKNGKTWYKVAAKTYKQARCFKEKYASAIGYIAKSKTVSCTTLKIVAEDAELYGKPYETASTSPVPEHAEVKQVSVSKNGAWAKVTYGDKTGYMRSDALKAKVLRVLPKSLTIRKAAELNSAVVKTVHWNSQVTVISEFKLLRTIWAKVECDGKAGVVKSYDEYVGRNLGYATTKLAKEGSSAYSLPDASSDAISVPRYFRPKVIERDGDWCYVSLGDKNAWMQSDDLEPLEYAVKGDWYSSVSNMRAGNPVGSLPEQVVECVTINKSAGYMKVKVDGETAYMRTKSIVDDPYVTDRLYVANSGLVCLEKPYEDSTFVGRESYMWKVGVLGTARTTSSGKYLAIEHNGDVAYAFQSDEGDPVLTDAKDDFEYEASNAMQQMIIDNAKDMVFNKETLYVNYPRGTIENGVYRWDCSSLSGWLLDTAVRSYTGEKKWTVANGTTRWTSAKCVARKMCRTKYCLDGTKKYPTKTLWKYGDDPNSFKISELECGDLLFFRFSPNETCPDHSKNWNNGDRCPDHVGVYLGNGQFVQCTKRFMRCVITPIMDDYTPQGCLTSVVRYLPKVNATNAA